MKRSLRFLGVCSVFLLSSVGTFAQYSPYQLTAFPLNDLSGFRSPGKNWSIAGQVAGSFAGRQFRATPGQGILLNTLTEKDPKYQASQNLFTTFEHGDLILETDFMMPAGANSGIYLQGRYEIQLFDSWGVKSPGAQDCGSIYERWDESKPEGQKGYGGHPARTNACFAPGLWQHLWIEFQAPRFDAAGRKVKPAKFVKVALNGVVLHENVLLSGPTRSAAFTDEKPKGALMIQGDHGSVAFRNMRYAFLDEFAFGVKDISYAYYEGKDLEKIDQVKPAQLVRKGSAEAIDNRLADARDKYYLAFTGTFVVNTPDTYRFSMPVTGIGQLEVNGKAVIEPTWGYLRGKPLEGSIPLTAGEHSFKVHCLKNAGWAEPGLGLFVQKPNSKPLALHAGPSMPEPDPTPLIEVKTQARPVLVRSFLDYEGRKKTHCISLGDPAGVNLSYDLNQAGVLCFWKGPFLNTTEMWFERGEPQTAAPLGARVTASGKCPVTIYSDASQMLPDSLDDKTELIYKGYRLDSQRYPTFSYQYHGVQIADRFQPFENGKGWVRQVTVSQAPAGKQLAFRLAEGKTVAEIGKGVYRIENETGGYYVQLPPDARVKPIIQDKNGGRALVVPQSSGKNASNQLTYTVIW